MDFNSFRERLLAGKAEEVANLTESLLQEGVAVGEILKHGLIAGMAIVGEKFKANEIFVPEVLLSARAMQAGMKVLEPLLVGAGIKPVGKVAIGTVKGDLHDIGKNLVVMMLKGGGFQVEDFGIDVDPKRFVEAAASGQAQIVAMSALLTTSMPSMKATIEGLRGRGLAGKVKTMIGGAPVTQEYAEEIGADGYAKDAASAVEVAKQLLGVR